MSTFNLSGDTIARLRAKFEEFRREREKLHWILADYVADYRQFQGMPDDRKEYLEKRYARRAVTVSSLVLGDGGEVYWNIQDIAILLARNPSSISRTIAGMERADGWCSRLFLLRKEIKSPNGNKIYVYHSDIFDLILDRYEEKYLLRFTEPRRGDKDKAPDMNEVRRFWQYLKDSADVQKEYFVSQEEEMELPDLPPMRWKDILSLIFGKAFCGKTSMLISGIIVVLCCFMFGIWPGIVPWIAAGSGITFVVCAILLRLHRSSAGSLSVIGAAAVLAFLACLANASRLYEQRNERKIWLTPEIGKGSAVNFRVESTFYDNLKEVFFSIEPEGEYHSTGLTDLNYPDLLIEPGQRSGDIAINIKYVDTDGNNLGPWRYAFDIDKERFRLSRDFILNQQDSWLNVSRMMGTTSVKVYIDSNYADNVVRAVVYGINTDSPDIFVPISGKKPSGTILRRKENDIQYVSSYLIFNDGTSSDIRRSNLKSSAFD